MRRTATFLLLIGGFALVPAQQAAAGTAGPLLGPGSRGPEVATWQRVLGTWLTASVTRPARTFRERHGLLAVDGLFGQLTTAATRAFQREGRIRADGIVGPQTRREWVSAFCTFSQGAGPPVLRRGDVGACVGLVQVVLDRWLAGARLGRQLLADGIYGPRTERAVLLFQRERHLRADRVVGRPTWDALARLPRGLNA